MVNEEKLKTLCSCENKAEDSFKWSIREMFARKMSSTIWGQGYIFQSNNKNIEKKFKKFEKMNRLLNLLSYAERYLSLYGRAIITINKTKTGDIMLNMPNPFFFNGVGKVFVQPQLAVVWQRYKIDTYLYVVKTTYDCEKVVNELYTQDAEGKNTRVFDKEAEILKSLEIEPTWYHHLGFVPVVELTNISFYQFNFNNLEFASLADWYPSAFLEPILYTTFKNLQKELKFCHSRLLIENADQRTMETLRQKMAIDIEDNDFIVETEVGANYKPQPGNGDFTKYTQTLDHLMDFYFKFAGGSRFSEGGGAQKTVAETSTVRSAMIESVNNKLVLRNEQISDLLKKVLCALDCISDYWDSEEYFTFKVNGNILRDNTTFIDNIIKQIENGLMSVEEGIQEIRQISKEQASEIFENIKTFNEENNIMNSMMMSEETFNNEESNFNQTTGEHKDPAKQGIN